jgi:hypothetical protein
VFDTIDPLACELMGVVTTLMPYNCANITTKYSGDKLVLPDPPQISNDEELKWLRQFDEFSLLAFMVCEWIPESEDFKVLYLSREGILITPNCDILVQRRWNWPSTIAGMMLIRDLKLMKVKEWVINRAPYLRKTSVLSICSPPKSIQIR